jgi:dTDP-4-amino-4,6-dideoxygalactose transaminase
MKSRLTDLAVFGGAPAFDQPRHVGRPNIGSRTRLQTLMRGMLDSAWLTNDGPYVRAFERAIAEQAEVAHCVATCNATAALEIAIRACGLSGEVIVPAFTFVATAHAVRWIGLTPVFADIDPATHHIDPARIEPLITPRTSAIIGVDLWGRACDADVLETIAARHNLTLIFDAAQAFGSTYHGRHVGGRGRAEVFSFHATKVVNSFEGGAIVTNDTALAERAVRMRQFGFAGYDTVVDLGTNAKMTEAAAAMGLVSLESLNRFVAINHARYEAYRKRLRALPGVWVMPYDERERSARQYVVVEIDEAAAGLSRDALLDILHAENVLARRYFYPGCHRMEPYRSEQPDRWRQLPETERLAARLLCLPTGTSISSADVAAICQIVQLALTHAPAVRARFEEAATSATVP